MFFFSQVNTTLIPTRDAPGTPSKCTATSQREARPASSLIKSQMEWVAFWNPLRMNWPITARQDHNILPLSHTMSFLLKPIGVLESVTSEMYLVWLLVIGGVDPNTSSPLKSNCFTVVVLFSTLPSRTEAYNVSIQRSDAPHRRASKYIFFCLNILWSEICFWLGD